jgi:hypothetical protein
MKQTFAKQCHSFVLLKVRAITSNKLYAKLAVDVSLEKLAKASSKLSIGQKCTAIGSTMKLLSSVLLDIKYTIPNQAQQMSTIVNALHASMTNAISQSVPFLKEHITITRDKLASAQALQDSLKPQKKLFMNKAIGSLTEELEMAEKLNMLCEAEYANGRS